MDFNQSSTSVAESSPSKVSFDLKPLLLAQPAGSSIAVRNRIATGSKNQRQKTSLQEHAAKLMVPERKVGPSPSVFQSIRAIITASRLNILLLCIPISWVLNFATPNQHALIFLFSSLAIIPLVKLLAFATDQLSMRVGQTLACLMNITLGNAAGLIVFIVALVKCEIAVVQSSLVGSILSNLLLVLGMCFFAGGLRFSEQGFGSVSAKLDSTLLTISVIAVLLPGAFLMSLGQSPTATPSPEVLKMSHGVAIILLFVYFSYLFFQLSSHQNLYQDDNAEILKSKKYTHNPFKIRGFRHRKRSLAPEYAETPLITSPQPRSVALPEREAGGCADPEAAHVPPSEAEELEEPLMSVPVSFGLLLVATVLVAVTAEFLVGSINGLTKTSHISKEFIGVILLPIVGNAAEHIPAVTVSVKDKLTHSLGAAVGLSIQIALFVIPFIITLAWIMNKPLTLLFDPFQSIVLFLAVLTVNYIVQNGRSNWLEGVILMCLYLIVAVAFWFYPGTTAVSC